MMRPASLTLVLLSAAGCASTTPAKIAGHTTTHEMSSPRKMATVVEAPVEAPVAALPAGRHLGDFVVFKFSGSYRKTTLTLREEIAAHEGSVVSIDYKFADAGQAPVTFRVRQDQAAGGKGGTFGFQRADAGGTLIDATRDEFEAQMNKTVLITDDNEETLGSTTSTFEVSGLSFAAKTTSFRVRVGKTAATMKLTQSDDFAWGDLGAEIVASNGAVLYRAELVEAGNSYE